MKVENILANVPDIFDKEIFQCLAESEHVKIEKIVSKGHTSPKTGWYNQDWDEWVMVIEGKAIISFADGHSLTLKKGDFITIPAHKKHKVDWTEPETNTVWLAVHYK